MNASQQLLLVAALVAATAALAQPGKPALMQDAHALVFDHTTISRTIEVLPNGARTVTTTTNPELLAVLQRHPREMVDHLKDGGMVRAWDPLFVELAVVQDEIDYTFENVENGVAVVGTSENPEVVRLIRAHAEKVSDMAERGPVAMREPTPLPEGYVAKNQTRGAGCCAVGRGNGRGQGRGNGMGSGNGRGQGRGKGVGAGNGRGQGRGNGMGPGNGRGQGRGNGMGPGNGRGQGRGAGVGAGNGRGQGRGHGKGVGAGNGLGLGQGRGQGMGAGNGRGCGGGQGRGQGMGAGSGRGQGWQRGRGANAPGKGLGNASGRGYRQGPKFVDEDGDGVNDNFVDRDGDGYCDSCQKILGLKGTPTTDEAPAKACGTKSGCPLTWDASR